jgi:L,D-transpeptidase ErfK/SrfK
VTRPGIGRRALRSAALGLAATALLGACGGLGRGVRAKPEAWTEARFARKPMPTHRVHLRDGVPVETVIGRVGTYKVRPGDTLLDVARAHGLGYNEIVDANPGVDPWVPPVGAPVVLPTSWVLPCCTYDGLVLNIPEMRLYHYRRAPKDPATLLVETYPVGLGRTDRRTPRGRFKVRGKTVNPTWIIPERIRQEHIREHGDDRRSIPGGHPDNPLGRYRIELTIPYYTIHGTNNPWGAGMAVSHGCARLYPEDVEHLFPHVRVGMPVEFTYQPVKVGRRRDGTYLEAHADVYGLAGPLHVTAEKTLGRLGGRVDRRAVRGALDRSRGVPVRCGGCLGEAPVPTKG